MTKAAVFPEPVLAMPTTSMPCRMSGMALRWIGVGRRYPLRRMPLRMGSERPMVSGGEFYVWFLDRCLSYDEKRKGVLLHCYSPFRCEVQKKDAIMKGMHTKAAWFSLFLGCLLSLFSTT